MWALPLPVLRLFKATATFPLSTEPRILTIRMRQPQRTSKEKITRMMPTARSGRFKFTKMWWPEEITVMRDKPPASLTRSHCYLFPNILCFLVIKPWLWAWHIAAQKTVLLGQLQSLWDMKQNPWSHILVRAVPGVQPSCPTSKPCIVPSLGHWGQWQ